MPNQQRFEGPELEALLDDVRDRFGSDVAIVEANKIRKGGVGGFFARELFEVVVEPDGAADAPIHVAAGGDAPAGRGLMDLVDAVDDGPMPSTQMPVEADSPAVAALLEKLDETRARGTALAPSEHATVSTDGDAFAEVLGRIARSTDTESLPGGGDVDDSPFRAFADVAPRTTSPAPAAPTATPSNTASNTGAPASVRGQRSRQVANAPGAGAGALDPGRLARLGLPPSVLEHPLRAADRISGLLELAETFPRARELPSGPDTVIALVGDRSAMERAIAWVNDQLGLHPDRLMLATRSESRVFPAERRIGGHERAASLRSAWRRRERPVLVAVDAPVGLRHTTWTRHVLDALEPAAVWAVVDAQRKPEDVVEWSERIGGVDAIALDRTEETASPAAVLTTGLPVSLLDGHQATPARWAAVLDERLLVA